MGTSNMNKNNILFSLNFNLIQLISYMTIKQANITMGRYCSEKLRLILLIIVTITFSIGLGLNLWVNQALFNVTLNVVPNLQSNSSLGSDAFIFFMNVVSNIFNPVLCAGYLIIFYLLSSRRLQILMFLIWFIFLSFCLSFLKQLIHQPRPYWIPDGQVDMLEWICYTEYGCPSGHSMLGIILLEFFLRFFARSKRHVAKYIGFYYLLIMAIELLVMFSRVFLGMHAINQVLFGLMIGLYCIAVYYLIAEFLVFRLVMTIFKHRLSSTLVLILFICIASISLEILITFLPTYNNRIYLDTIIQKQGCSAVNESRSFHYRCFQDMALFMAVFGMLLAFHFLKEPQNLSLPFAYSKLSCTFLIKTLLTVIAGLVPAAIFLNPMWKQFGSDNDNKGLIIWSSQSLAFSLGMFGLIWGGEYLALRNNVQCYKKITGQGYYYDNELGDVGQQIEFKSVLSNSRRGNMEPIDLRGDSIIIPYENEK